MKEQPIFESADDAVARRIEQLQQQERIWFSWVCRLHDVHAGTQTPHSAAVLAIAQRRWAEARRSLERLDAPGDDQGLNWNHTPQPNTMR